MHMDRPVFVFSSNLSGHHDDGAALEALRNRGATYGDAHGLQGNSYAVPTRDENFRALPLIEITENITRFLEFARTHPWLLFDVTPIACGHTGYTPEDIAPHFRSAPHNVTLPPVLRMAA